MLTADIGSHVDTFLELVADADDNDDESVVDVVVDIGGNFDSVVIGLVCLHQCSIFFEVQLRFNETGNCSVVNFICFEFRFDNCDIYKKDHAIIL